LPPLQDTYEWIFTQHRHFLTSSSLTPSSTPSTFSTPSTHLITDTSLINLRGTVDWSNGCMSQQKMWWMDKNNVVQWVYSQLTCILLFAVIKWTYSMHMLSVIFCGRCSFFVLNMGAKNLGKIQPLGHFSGLALRKKLRFCMFGRKIKINRDLVGMLRNFTYTFIKIHIEGVKSLVAFRISLDFFCWLKHAKSQLLLKSRT